jgi:hypothetical protein
MGLLSGMMNAFGAIVIVFAILERVLPAKEIEKEMEDEWNPADLAKEPDPDEVKTSEAIVTIIFTVIGLVIFNLYPDMIGLFFNTDGEWTFIPMLSDAFFTYLPWINLLGILQIVFNLYLHPSLAFHAVQQALRSGALASPCSEPIPDRPDTESCGTPRPKLV